MKKTTTSITLAIALFIGLGWLGFEIFNATTTYDSISSLIIDNLLSVALTTAFVAIDLAGLFRVVTPETAFTNEPMEIKLLFSAWLIVAVFNAFLTWWNMSLILKTNPMVSSLPEDMRSITIYAPVVISIIVFLLRVLLISFFGIILDKLIHDKPKMLPNHQGNIHQQQKPQQKIEIANAQKKNNNNSNGNRNQSQLPSYYSRPSSEVTFKPVRVSDEERSAWDSIMTP